MTHPRHDIAELPGALRAHAAGLHACEAAAELLISHRPPWLSRTDFIDQFVHIEPGFISAVPMATIDWDKAIDTQPRKDRVLTGRGTDASSRCQPGRRHPGEPPRHTRRARQRQHRPGRPRRPAHQRETASMTAQTSRSS